MRLYNGDQPILFMGQRLSNRILQDSVSGGNGVLICQVLFTLLGGVANLTYPVPMRVLRTRFASGVYIRVSSHSQKGDSQQAAITPWLASHGHPVDEVRGYQDQESGKTISQCISRPVYQSRGYVPLLHGLSIRSCW